MLSLAHEILPTLGYRIDAIADPVEELKSVILAASGFTGIDERFADLMCDRFDSEADGYFKRSMLNGLGYRADSVESFDDAVRTLLAPYRTDAIADVRDLISAKATEQLGEQIQGFTKAIATKVKSWKDENLSPKEISDRIDNLYADLDGTEFAEGLADWLAIAYLSGGEGAIPQ